MTDRVKVTRIEWPSRYKSTAEWLTALAPKQPEPPPAPPEKPSKAGTEMLGSLQPPHLAP